jgi:hypothetical protein
VVDRSAAARAASLLRTWSAIVKVLTGLCLLFLAPAAWSQCSPIVVDLNKDGIRLGPAGVGVYFDVDADGGLNRVQWVRQGGDEAFLALDRNRNGVIDDGSELFGIGTFLQLEGGRAPNGFVGLAQYDDPRLGGNDDGLITAADAVWSELVLWNDTNADGVSTGAEIQAPGSLGFTSFETIPKVRRYRDEAGNFLPYFAWARTLGRPSKTLMVDVYFLEI